MEQSKDPLPPGKREELELEHGCKVVTIQHPDGSCFGFKRMDRAAFDLLQKRTGRGQGDAMEMLLQERCVYPSREAWNKYVSESSFEVLAYQKAYKEIHGHVDCFLLGSDELPEDATEGIHISNKEVTFAFRKPNRSEVKQFQHMFLSSDPKASETLVRACATPECNKWFDDNLFGIREFGDELVRASGFTDTKASK